MQVLNINKLKETKELLADGWDDFLQVFLSELENDINKIISGEDITLASHSQKSSCALLGAEDLSNTFARIESLSRDSKDISEHAKLLLEKLTNLKTSLDIN